MPTTTDELRNNAMMANLLDSLEAGKDIGHYGRLVFAMVARHFMEADDVVAHLAKDKDFSEEQAQALLAQVEARGYNPPKREKVLEFLSRQEFQFCPAPEDPDACNVYKDLEFPREVYERITQYYEQKS